MSDFEDKINSVLSDPESMQQILSLARSLGASIPSPESSGENSTEQEADPPPKDDNPDLSSLLGSLGNIDPKIMNTIMGVMTQLNSETNSKHDALFSALRPYLRDERQEKLDKAVKAAKFAQVARAAMSNLNFHL